MNDIIRQTRKGRLVIRSQHRRRSIRAAILTSILHTVACTCLMAGALQLYCISQGADDLYLGILTCFIWAGAPFQLLGMILMHRLGKRRILIFWAGIMPAICTAFMAVLPIAGHFELISPNWILYWLLAATLMRSISDNIGGAGWFPMLQDNVPTRITGKFFGTFRIYWQSSALISTLLIAWFLGKTPGWWQFCIVFAIGEICFLVKIYFLQQLQEKPIVNQSIIPPSVWGVIKQVFGNRQILFLMGYILLYNIAAFMCLPFQIKYLKELGYSDGFIVFATSMISLGAIVSLRYWGRLADRFGNRAIFNFSHIGMVVAMVSWLLIGQNTFSMILVFVLYGLWSIFQSANGIAQTRYLFHIIPETNQSLMVVVNTSLALSISLSPLIGGLCLWTLSEVKLQTGAFDLNRYHMLFLFGALLVAIPHYMHKRLEIGKDRTTMEVFAIITRPLRSFFGSFIVFPKDRIEKK